MCLNRAPSQNRVIHQALVCGQSLPAGRTLHLFRQSALIHILVVSGSHLIVLLQLLQAFLNKGWLKTTTVMIVLGGFTLMCGLQAPVVRSLCSMALQGFSRQHQLHWSALQVTCYSGLCCLVLNPSWAQSQSLLLSWISALALVLLSRLPVSNLARHTLIWLMVAPALLPLCAPGPLGILCNLMVAPVIGAILFPLSLLSFLFTPALELFSALWSALMRLLEVLVVLQERPSFPVSLASLWSYVLILHSAGQLARFVQRISA